MKAKAFTLIELIVVVAIIGVLLVISVVAFGTTRLKGRDTQRLSDIALLQNALERYYRDEGVYPPSLTPGTALVGLTSSTTYLATIPTNPSPRADNGCDDSEYVYSYKSGDNTYEIDFCLGGSTGDYQSGGKCARPSGISEGVCFLCGESTISYEGKSYTTVQIGTQCWLAQNLNVGTRICTAGTTCVTEPDDNFDHDNIEKYCYQNYESNCDTYGALYTWTEMMGLPNKCKVGNYTAGYTDYYHHYYTHATDSDCNFNVPLRGICPDGWHIPSYIHGMTGDQYYNDWNILIAYLSVDGQGGAGIAVGGKMKETGTTRWTSPNTGATNSSGFTGVGTGLRGYGGSYSQLKNYGYFFVTQPASTPYSWLRGLAYNGDGLWGGTYWGERNNAWPVRCVKDTYDY